MRNAQMLIEQRLLFHERRAAKIHAMIAERRQTAHDVARSMWGDRALTQAFLTLCEILGHVDLLIEDGRVRELDDGEIVRLEA
ncbi:MAG: hypothetical protein JO130_05645 [Solirubrobacterales bacterium]|nr:hypothetical protein [Solirubrobacterales bacterium]